MDDDLDGEGRGEVGVGQLGPVVVVEELRQLSVLGCVEQELGVDLVGRRWQHVQVVEGAVITEATQITITNHLLVSFGAMSGIKFKFLKSSSKFVNARN